MWIQSEIKKKLPIHYSVVQVHTYYKLHYFHAGCKILLQNKNIHIKTTKIFCNFPGVFSLWTISLDVPTTVS